MSIENFVLFEAKMFIIIESKSFITLLKILFKCKRDNVIIQKLMPFEQILKRAEKMKVKLKK